MRRDPLVFDATSAASNVLIHGGPKSGKTTALQTFILSAAALHSPRDVTFYCLDYGGGQLRAVGRPRPRRQRRLTRSNPSASGAPSASSSSCCAHARSAGTTEAGQETVAPSGRLRRGLPGHRQPVRVQPGQHRHVQHPESRCWPRSPSWSTPECPTASTSSSPRRTGSRCRWPCATGSACGWSSSCPTPRTATCAWWVRCGGRPTPCPPTSRAAA